MEDALSDILKSLGLPPPSRKIYEDLLVHGEATARTIAERLMLTRPSTYDHLAFLKKQGLIVERDVDNKAYFAIDDARHVERLLTERAADLEEKREAFTKLLPSLTEASHTAPPTIKFFEGKLGLTHLLYDMLSRRGGDIFTMWPYDEMLRVLGKEVLIRFNERRLRERIRIHTLWPHGKNVTSDYIWSGKDALTERRQARKGVYWNMGYTIYGDRVSFISSHREVFGFIVSSKDFAELMRVQFDALWRESTAMTKRPRKIA